MIELKVTSFLGDLVKLRGAVGRTDTVLIGQTMRASDNVWAAEIRRDVYNDEDMLLSFDKLTEVVRSCNQSSVVRLEKKGPKCVIKSAGAAWVLNLRDQEVPEYPQLEGKSMEASGPNLLDAYMHLKHLIKLDLSRPGLMFGLLADGDMMLGDGHRLGGCKCRSDDFEIPLVVFQELGRLLKMYPDMPDLMWTETDDFYDFTLDNMSFAAKKMEGGFEVEWKEAMQEGLNVTEGAWIATPELLAAVNQAMVTAGDDLVMKCGEDSIIIEGIGEMGEKGVAKVLIVEGSLPNAKHVRINGREFGESLRSRMDKSVFMKISKQCIGLEDTQGWEILSRVE